MKRVAALYLPDWPIERLWQAERTGPPLPPETTPGIALDATLGMLSDAAAAEQEQACSVPRGGGWRPGARWAREERARQIAALPAHQQPTRRELGRRDEAAGNPFRPMQSDEVRSQVPAGEPPAKILPGTGRGTKTRSGLVEGAPGRRSASGWAPSTTGFAGGPPPRSGEELIPLVTSIRTGNRVLVAAACPAARALGIVPGMAVTQARALMSGLDIRPADPAGDLAALHSLALLAARRWAPSVAVEGADTLLIDLTGVAHLHGGEARMARRIVRLLARRGYRARIAIADTPGAAWALAHFAVRDAVLICAPGQQADALAPLPIPALRVDPAAVELLRRLGVERIGPLAAMPRAPLARRFGGALVTRLEQALGTLPEPLDPVVPREAIAVQRRFAEPVATAEGIAHWIGALVPELCVALEAAGLGARAVELVADRVDGVPQRIRIGLARASRDALHLTRLIARRIEDVEPGYGIDAIALHVRRAEPLAARPFDERLDEEAKPDLAPLADTLATRIGPRRIWRSRPVESDVPERSVGRDAILDPPDRGAMRMKPDDVRQLQSSAPPDPWRPDWPRPARLLARPERLDHVLAELPDQPPRRFTWRGRTVRVVRADGPERIAGEWWRRSAETHAVRDYFRVEDEGGHRYWLFRRGDGERAVTGDLSWYLHGLFG
ncbi:protein ImuB [Sphingomonas sp. BE123]|uniref:Y-family DNA polymerase n=1 Tax=Sphingomonas sp. BE123 TaxID=2817842 RepID=UPI002856EC38|nr:DNA polymerase Y family protein [Sphingomonas sp. BE123]MDR6852756.1 protein ImuB [Sphingomonas sp. BE123]